MWVFCKHGFFSAVQHDCDLELVHVRARFRDDLERLCQAFDIPPRVEFTPNHDYAYRMNFTKDQWALIMAAEAEQIDYTNFKNAVHDGTARDRAYMQCWYALSQAQK